MAADFEDKFLQLRDEHRELQQKYNEAQVAIRRLNTMLQQIDNSLQKKARLEATADGSIRRPVNRDTEALIKEMFDKNKTLITANKRLEAKNKQLTEQLEKKKRELQLAKKHALVRRNAAGPPASLNASRLQSASRSATVNQSSNNEEFNAISHARLLEVSKRLQARLKEAEKALEEARNENTALKENSAVHANASTIMISENVPIEARELQLRLKESQTQLHLLQRRYDALASQADAQTQRHLDYEEQIHGYASRIKELKNTLEELMHEKGVAEMKATRLKTAEEEVVELRTTNRMLEDKIKRLGEVPFISDAFHQNDVSARLAMLEAEREENLMKIQHLQEAARTHHSALVTLQQQASQLRDEKEAAIRQLEDMNVKFQQSETGNQLLNDRLRIYAGDELDMKDLDQALTIVRRRTGAENALSFLERADDNGNGADSTSTHTQMRRKLESVQLMNLNLTQENERLENMLKSQSAINRELQKELEDLLRRQAMDKGELLHTINDLESIAAKRQHKVLQLEAQVRELMYSGKKKSKQASQVPLSEADQMPDEDADDTLMEDLLLDEEYSAGDNLVEIWIQSAKLRDGVVTPGACTFATVDFFNFESQATSLLVGNNPAYDFAASYKIAVDDLFLVYLATQTASFELLQAVQGDFVTLGRCAISLRDLLRHKPNFTKTAHLISVRDSSVIGELNVRFRMAMPIVELYRVFLERNPAQRETIKRLQQQQALANLPQEAVEEKKFLEQQLAVINPEDESRLYNELEVKIQNATGLVMAGADVSSIQTYVHFKLLGFPHSLTDVVAGDANPEYDAEFTFPIITDDKQRQLLRKAQLVFNVINYRAGAEDAPPTAQDDDFIGEATVPLAQLADGDTISGDYAILDKRGKPVGQLSVALGWLYTFRTERQLSGHALSSTDVAEIIKQFAQPNADRMVDAVKFARFVDPSVTALVALNKLATHVTEKCEANTENSTQSVLLTIKPTDSDKYDVDTFLTALLPLEIGLASDDIISLFEWLDVRKAGKVDFDQLVWAVDLERTLYPALLVKLRQRAHAVREQGKTSVQLFLKLDTAGDGVLTERNFKEGLRLMGFDLVDEPEADNFASVDFLRLSGQKDEPFDGELLSHAQRQALQGDGPASRYASAADDGDILTSTEDLPFRMNRSQFDKQEEQREAFNRRRRELQRRSEERLTASQQHMQDPQILRESTSSLTEPAVAQTVTVRDSGERDMDEAHVHAAAKILQSSYRDYRARRPPRLVSPSPMAASTPGRPPLHPASARASTKHQQQHHHHQQQQVDRQSSTDASPLLSAEDVLRAALDSLKAVRAPPDFMEWFGKIDQRNTGVVGRKQFFYVLSKYPELSLGPHATKAFADYFERGSDEIDYHAFMRFASYQPPRTPQFAQDLSSMVFTADTYFQFRSLDPVRSGTLLRSAVVQALHQLGYGQFSESSFQAMCATFEFHADGDVDYANFFETVRCTALSQQYEETRSFFQHAILSSIHQTGDMDDSLRQWFARMDRSGLGKCSVDDLATFLQDMDIHAPAAVVAALYRSLDHDKVGIHFADFKTFVLGREPELPSFRVLTLAEQQHKAFTVLFDYAARGELDAVTNAFYAYDWARNGFVGKPEFVRAASRCGFLFTPREYRQLMTEFLWDDGVHVSYPAFLAWATPTSPTDARLGATAHVSDQAYQVIGTKLAEAYGRGVNLSALFRRHDREGRGKISPADFCAALADIGISSLVVDEAIAYADRARVLDGNQIRYLSILSDLEQQVAPLKTRLETPLQRLSQVLSSGTGVEGFLRACQSYDLDSYGRIERQDLPRVFRKLKIELPIDDMDALCDQFAVGAREVDYRRMVEHLLKTGNRLTSSQQLGSLRSATGKSLPFGLSSKITNWLKSLIQRGVDFRTELDSHDHEGHGALLVHDFRTATQALNHPFQDRELVAVENAYKVRSPKRGGTAVDYVALLNEHHPKNGTSDSLSSSELALWKISENLRLKIRRHCNYWMPGDLRGPFAQFDQGGDGVITLPGLVKGLGPAHLNMNVHPEQAKALFDQMKLSNPNGVGYCEFVVFVCDPFHSDVADKFFAELARVGASSREVIRVCDDCDTHATGLLSMPQFLKAIRRLGLNLSTSDAERLVRRCDLEQTGLLSIALFSQLLRGPTSSAATAATDDMSHSHQPQDDILREQFVLLRRAVRNKHDAGYTAGEIWSLFEPDRSGHLTAKGLLDGAKALGVVLQRTMVRPLLAHLESLAEPEGEVSRSNLLDVFGITHRSQAWNAADGKSREEEESRLGGGSGRPPLRRVERALGRLHDLLLELPRTRRSYPRFHDALSRQYGDVINFPQFQDFVHELVPAASSADLRDIFDFVADHGARSAQSSKIALELTPPTQQRISDMILDRSHKLLLDNVLHKCRAMSGRIRELPGELQEDERQSVMSVARANSFSLALEHIGCRLNMSDARDLMDLLDPDDSGVVKYRDFINFVEDNTDFRDGRK